MSFEQLDNERWEQEKKKNKKEKEKTQQFWLEKEINAETSSLLNKLASEISKEFGLSISEVKSMISDNTLGDLEGLKKHIGTSRENINIERLQWVISDARESISDLSKKRREVLRSSLEQNIFNPEKHEYKLKETLFWEETIARGINPQIFSDQFIGLWLGIIDSTEAIIFFTYNLWKWIIMTPYHIYLLLTGKAKYEWFSRI